MNDYHEKKLVWIAWAIMIGILGPVISFVGPNLIHEIFLKTGNTLYIDTPMLANILFLCGTVVLVLFCVLMYFGKKFLVFSFSSLVVACALLYLSNNYYLIMTKDKLEQQPLFSFSKISYDWDDIEKGKMQITDERKGTGSLILTFKDGHVISFERNDYMIDNFGMINFLLKENGVVYDIEIKEDTSK
jgi:hypothetical protein